MDFIERRPGFSPDGGDGSVEIPVLVVLVMLLRGASAGDEVKGGLPSVCDQNFGEQ